MTRPMPWRILILDVSADDPKWLLCSVTIPSDVRPAVMDGRRYTGWAEAVEWVRNQVGGPVALVPIAAMAWRVDEGGQPRG
jgi:hypothetical protein